MPSLLCVPRFNKKRFCACHCFPRLSCRARAHHLHSIIPLHPPTPSHKERSIATSLKPSSHYLRSLPQPTAAYRSHLHCIITPSFHQISPCMATRPTHDVYYILRLGADGQYPTCNASHHLLHNSTRLPYAAIYLAGPHAPHHSTE